MNLANKLTLLRIALVPVFVAFMSLDVIEYNYFWAFVVFAVASITDFADGKIARKYNMITDFGKFLDPLADKVLTVSAIICFVESGLTYAWVAAVIIGREFMVSGVRMVAAGKKENIVIAADLSGKIKTAFTMIAITAILIMLSAVQFEVLSNSNTLQLITDVLMYISALLTVWSGGSYMYKYRKVFDDM